MDDRTFDWLIRSLSAATAERRQAIKGLFGAALGLSLGQLALSESDAKKKKKRKKKRKKKTQDPPNTCEPQCAGDQSCISGECWPDSEERAFVTLINNHRAANGRPPLTLQNQLGRAAELHSRDQASTGNSSHTGSNGSSPEQRIDAAGYNASYAGENIYWNSGDGSASAAFNWWKTSPGHNANMLSTDYPFTEFGIGRARRSANGYWYWTTTFGSPS